MKIIKSIISLVFIFALFLCFPVVASAETTPIDWSNVDFESFHYQNLDANQWTSLGDWLQKNADLHTVFYVTATKGDGWVAEMWCSIVYSLFMENPVPFIQALALEDEETQDLTISRITFEANVHEAEFEQLMCNLILPDTATDREQTVLMQMISRAEEKWGMTITSPKTGDFNSHAMFSFVPLLMIISGFGIVILLKLRKIHF